MTKQKTVLTRSNDRKVANLVRTGTKLDKRTGERVPDFQSAIANAFGLPSGITYSCPGATAFCLQICYAGRLEKAYKGVTAVMLRNWEALKDSSRADMVAMIDAMVTEFSLECDKKSAQKIFRIHWDGDFFNATYVSAWHAVISQHPDIQFWAYTRVPTAATYLHAQKLANLALYFSGDSENVAIAKHLETLGMNIAYVETSFAKGKEAFPNATRCPENNKAIPLITGKGSACSNCGLCVTGRKSVLFSTTKS